MYYEEKIIDEMLHFRRTPNGMWLPMPNKELTKRIQEFESEISRLQTLAIRAVVEGWTEKQVMEELSKVSR